MASKKSRLDSREESAEGHETDRGNWDELPQEVLNMIFNHLPVADLLSCSVMSKNWKKASRDVLKRSRECYAYVKHFRRDMQALNDMIASTDLMQMFNGLHIQNRPKNNSRRAAPASSWRKDSYTGNVLQLKHTRRRLEKAIDESQAVLCGQWRYLKLYMGYRWRDVLSIDDALLLAALMKTTRESLEKLIVKQDPYCSFISWCGSREFSNLKVLHIQDVNTSDDSWLEPFMLKFAPNLEEITGAMLHVKVHSPGTPFMLKRMKSIYVAPDDVIPQAGLMEGFRQVSGLYRLDLLSYHCRPSDDPSVLFSMVLKSLNTLEELRVCTLEFYKLLKMADEIKFPNLRRLTLATHRMMRIEHEILIWKWLNLPKLCPNLEHLERSVDDCYQGYEEEDEIPFEGPDGIDQSDLPVQISYNCRWQTYRHEHLEFLNQVYPNMNKVAVLKWKPRDDYEMSSIFSELRSLEYLEISVLLRYSLYDRDVIIAAILCGITIVEANFLSLGFPRTSAEPNIVPTRPSLFHAKNLKEIKITGEGSHCRDFVNHSWVIQITENLPVRHVRELKVTFEGSAALYRELNELRALRTLLCDQVGEN